MLASYTGWKKEWRKKAGKLFIVFLLFVVKPVLHRSRPKDDILILAQCEVQYQSQHPAG